MNAGDTPPTGHDGHHGQSDPRSTDAEVGLHALTALLGVHHVAADPGQMRHLLGHERAPTADELVRLARRQPGVRAKQVVSTAAKLPSQPLPALACGPEGWFIVGQCRDSQVRISRPNQPAETISTDELESIWSGELILLSAREPAGAARRFDLRWFVPQLVRYRRLIGEVLLISFALNILGLAAPLLFQNVIDKVLVHDSLATLDVLVFAFAAVSLWEVMFGWLRTRLFAETSQKLDVELGARLFRHLLALPLAYFEQRRVGDTVTRVRQLETVREFLTNASLTVLVDPVFALVFFAAMLVYSPVLAIVPVCSVIGYVAVSRIVTPQLRARLDEKFDRSAASNSLLVESVTGIQAVKAAAVEPQWQDGWERRLASYSAASLRVVALGSTGSQAIELISKLSFAAILFFGAKAVIAGTLSVGGLVAFNMFAQRLAAPIIRMAQLWQDFQQVRISVERLGDVLNHPVEPQARSNAAMPAMRGAVRLEDVSFRYVENGPATLDRLTLDIPAGSSIGVVGSSGSGKSTLAKLVQRMYLPASGRVFVDGHDLAHVDPAWLRRQIGVVLQDNVLFSRSIRENIALGHTSMPFERIVAAAKLAGAHDFITRLPHGYDTAVVERGANLSGGQRQRIAIARALVTDPRILILDEATSALDAESEEIVRTNLAAISANRTVIIIAHRLSAVSQCDRIITLEGGRIVEAGRHDELVRGDGRYADLFRRQNGLWELAA